MILREVIKSLLEMVTQEDKIESLQPDDVLTVYHGTGGAYLPMIHGIDATRDHHRVYGGPRHKGLFVTTDSETALRFASYGKVVFEIEAKAKNLYGTDWSGNTAKKQVGRGMPDPNDLWRDKYPNSFRPYLTDTLLQTSEPQALLVGIIRPHDIKRVQWDGEWYGRDELIDMMPEYYPPSERKPKKLERMPFDPTDGSITLDEFYDIVAKLYSESRHNVKDVISSWVKRGKRDFDSLADHLVQIGWRPNAAIELANKLVGKEK